LRFSKARVAEQPVISIAEPDIQYRQLTLIEEPSSSHTLEVWLAFLAQAEALPKDDSMRETLVALGKEGCKGRKKRMAVYISRNLKCGGGAAVSHSDTIAQ
jgi:hypothetical protein